MFKEYATGKINYQTMAQKCFKNSIEYQNNNNIKVFESLGLYDATYINEVCPVFCLNEHDGLVKQCNDLRFYLANSKHDNQYNEQYNKHCISYINQSGVDVEGLSDIILIETKSIEIFFSIIKSNIEFFQTIQKREVK